jgi:hypothetical protein
VGRHAGAVGRAVRRRGLPGRWCDRQRAGLNRPFWPLCIFTRDAALMRHRAGKLRATGQAVPCPPGRVG